MRICPDCKAENDDKAVYCRTCTALLAGTPPVPADSTSAETENITEAEEKTCPWFSVGTMVLCIVCLVWQTFIDFDSFHLTLDILKPVTAFFLITLLFAVLTGFSRNIGKITKKRSKMLFLGAVFFMFLCICACIYSSSLYSNQIHFIYQIIALLTFYWGWTGGMAYLWGTQETVKQNAAAERKIWKNVVFVIALLVAVVAGALALSYEKKLQRKTKDVSRLETEVKKLQQEAEAAKAAKAGIESRTKEERAAEQKRHDAEKRKLAEEQQKKEAEREKQARIAAQKEAEEAEREKQARIAAQERAEREKQARIAAQKEAEQEKQARIAAQERAEQEKQARIAAPERAEQERRDAEKRRPGQEKAERQREDGLKKELDDFRVKRDVWIAKAQKEDPEVREAIEHMRKADLNHPVLKDAVMAARCADVFALAAISRNGKINWQDPEIMLAACKPPFRITVQCVCDLGGDVNAKDKNGITALMVAFFRGNSEIMKYLVGKGADVNAKDNGGWTALIWASYQGNLETVKCLVEHGADVNAKDKDGWTALMWASSRGKLETVKCLVEHGADVNAKNNYGRTALELARYGNKQDVADYLTRKTAEK